MDETKTLRLRPFLRADDSAVSSWFTDAGQLRFFAGPRLTWPLDSRQWDDIRDDPTITAWTAVFDDDDEFPIGHGELVRESDSVVRFARFALAPDFRGARLGLSLGRALLQKARDGHYTLAALSVHPDNAPAIRAYRGLGFTAVSGEGLNGSLRMELSLGSSNESGL